MQRIHGKVISITLLVILSFPFAVNKVASQNLLAEQERALRMIADFADRLCKDIPLTGSGLELTGKAKAELRGIFKKIAELGLEGAAKYQNYEGLLQKDLAKALKDSSTCKLTVLKELNDKILGSGPSSKPRNDTEVITQLQSEVTKLLNFPDAISDTSRPRSVLESWLINQLPRRLFNLLIRYDERDILAVPKIGSALHNHLMEYYQFRQKSLRLESRLMGRIGQMVTVRFRRGWKIYLIYVIMRFGGKSKEDIIAGGNFLNYDITWDDAERVFSELSDAAGIEQEFSELFSLHAGMIAGLNTFATARGQANTTGR